MGRIRVKVLLKLLSHLRVGQDRINFMFIKIILSEIDVFLYEFNLWFICYYSEHVEDNSV